jgi:hypothetical protein
MTTGLSWFCNGKCKTYVNAKTASKINKKNKKYEYYWRCDNCNSIKVEHVGFNHCFGRANK